MTKRHARPGGILLAGLLFAGALWAREPHRCSILVGQVVEDGGGEGLPHVRVMVKELRQGGLSDGSGQVIIQDLPAGSWTLECLHLGHAPWRQQVAVPASDTLRVEIRLRSEALKLQDLTVLGVEERVAQLHEPTLSLSPSALQRLPGATLASVLEGQSGLARRSMGPAPARPVLRGLSGERLRIEEDGAGLGDLSASSADHAVALDPLSISRVNLLQGPSALLATSSAVGGVLEVERGLVPRLGLDHVEGEAALNGDSGSLGRAAALVLAAPVAGVDARVDGTWRAAGDLRTPGGVLEHSELDSWSGGLGVGKGMGHWRLGAGLSALASAYGIPGGFAGAHPQGVDVAMHKETALLQTAWTPDRAEDADRGLRAFSARSQWTRYRHEEREAGGALGLAFDQLTHEGQVELALGAHGPFTEGRLRFQQQWRSLASAGLTHMPTVSEQGLALATVQHATLAILHVEAALRADWRQCAPVEERQSVLVGHIRTRSFSGISGALSLAPVNEGPEWNPGVVLGSGWRAPSAEELFSGGPHLAAYAFEIGNPEAQAERSYSAEAFLQGQRHGMKARLSCFTTHYQGYLFPSFTGRFSPRRADLHEYRVLGRDARFVGVEALWTQDAGSWLVESSLSWVRGSLENGAPLPAMPPLRTHVKAGRRWGAWEAECALECAAPQARVYRAEDPGAQAESATAGWARVDAGLVWRSTGRAPLQQISLRLANVLDQEMREHLNRVRVLMPEAGRSLSLQWKVWF
jgi:iron complex outermembrane receptor protein